VAADAASETETVFTPTRGRPMLAKAAPVREPRLFVPVTVADVVKFVLGVFAGDSAQLPGPVIDSVLGPVLVATIVAGVAVVHPVSEAVWARVPATAPVRAQLATPTPLKSSVAAPAGSGTKTKPAKRIFVLVPMLTNRLLSQEAEQQPAASPLHRGHCRLLLSPRD
jgi:hypothetical protein